MSSATHTLPEGDAFTEFLVRQMRVSSELYIEQLKRHFIFFEMNSRYLAEETIAGWIKKEFIDLYLADLDKSLRDVQDSYDFNRQIVVTIEHDVLPHYSQELIEDRGFDRINYYISMTDGVVDAKPTYPHPQLIKFQIDRFANCIARQMQCNRENSRILLAGSDEPYVPLGWIS